jgi:DNA-directed RNA polymerase subunit omega
MARITVEDCESKVPNRFDLVLEGVERVRQILSGSLISIDPRKDKNPVIALREIAAGTVSVDDLHDSIIRSLQRHVQVDDEEQDVLSVLAEEEAWLSTLGAPEEEEPTLEEELEEDGLIIEDDADTSEEG